MTPYLWVCLGVSIGLLVAVAFDMTFRRCWHEWNWHTYSRIAVYEWEAVGEPSHYDTRVSAACTRCGKPRTKRFNGIVSAPPNEVA